MKLNTLLIKQNLEEVGKMRMGEDNPSSNPSSVAILIFVFNIYVSLCFLLCIPFTYSIFTKFLG
jgi:hypothetical protein